MNAQPYGTAKGKLWRLRYRGPDGQEMSERGFTTKRDALAWGAANEVKKMRGEYVAPVDSKVLVGDLGPAWLIRQAGHLKASSLRPLQISWRIHVEPKWGKRQIGSIRFSEVSAWLASMSVAPRKSTTGYSPTIVIRAASVLSGILGDAVADRLIPSNHAAGHKMPHKAPKRRVMLSHEQVWALANAAGEHRALVLVLAYCGLRWSEAGGLLVRDLDLLRSQLTVAESAVRVGSEFVVDSPKANRMRTVSVPPRVVDALAIACWGKADGDLVFPARKGGYLQPSNSTRGWWAIALAKSGVPRVTPHDLRHTCASLAVSSGAQIKALQRQLGHAKASMTLDVYADLYDDDLGAVGIGLGEAMGNLGAKLGPRDEVKIIGTVSDLRKRG